MNFLQLAVRILVLVTISAPTLGVIVFDDDGFTIPVPRPPPTTARPVAPPTKRPTKMPVVPTKVPTKGPVSALACRNRGWKCGGTLGRCCTGSGLACLYDSGTKANRCLPCKAAGRRCAQSADCCSGTRCIKVKNQSFKKCQVPSTT